MAAAQSVEHDEPCPYELKDAGNGFYKKGNLKDALETWKMALERLDEELGYWPSTQSSTRTSSLCQSRSSLGGDGKHHEALEELRVTLLVNLGLVCLKLDKPQEAVYFCNSALEKEPRHAKALFRKAQALKLLSSKAFSNGSAPVAVGASPGLQSVESCLSAAQVALQCLRKLLEVEPGNKDAQILLMELQKAERKKQRWLRALTCVQGGDKKESPPSGHASLETRQAEETASDLDSHDSMPSQMREGLMKADDVDLTLCSGEIATKRIISILQVRGACTVRCGTDTTTLGRAAVECRELYEDHFLRPPEEGRNFVDPHFAMKICHTALMSQTIRKNKRCECLRELGQLLAKFAGGLAKQAQQFLGLSVEAISDVELCYYPGAKCRHTLHLENPGGCGGRDNLQQLTFVYFICPQDWNAEKDGGLMRLTIPEDLSKPPRTIEQALDIETDLTIQPRGDTLVILRSKVIWWDLSMVHRESLACLVFHLMATKKEEDDRRAYDIH